MYNRYHNECSDCSLVHSDCAMKRTGGGGHIIFIMIGKAVVLVFTQLVAFLLLLIHLLFMNI